MLLDVLTQFSDAQAITASAASTNVVDLGASGTPVYSSKALNNDSGRGCPISLLIQVTEDFATLTSLTVAFETDDDVAFGSATVLNEQTIAVADLLAGRTFNPSFVPKYLERYVRLNYTVTGSDATAGTITAAMTAGDQSNNI